MKSIKYICEFLLASENMHIKDCAVCILCINTELVFCVMACEEPPVRSPSPAPAPAPAQPACQLHEEHLEADWVWLEADRRNKYV